MKIIEKYTKSKTGNPDDCESLVFHNDNFVSVIDGRSGWQELKFNGMKPGRFVAKLIEKTLSELDPKATFEQFIEKATSAIYGYYEENDMLELLREIAHKRASAHVITYSVSRKEVWYISGCQSLSGECLSSYETNQLKITLRSVTLEKGIELLEKETVDDRRYSESLMNDPMNCNERYGLGSLNGLPIRDICKNTSSKENSKILVFANQGYPQLMSTLKESEERLSGVLENSALLGLYSYHKDKLPDGYVSYADRAYVRFET